MIANRKLKPSPTGRPARPLPWRVALVLALVVTVVHLWLLAAAPVSLGLDASAAPPTPLQFSTRRIEPAASRPATAPPKAAQARTARPAAPRPEAPASEPAPVQAAQAPLPAPAASEEAATPAEPAVETVAALTPPPPPTSQQATRLQMPGSVRLRYDLSGRMRGIGYSADGLITWQQDGQRYEASMVISGLLLLNPRTMTSVGELGPQGVAPRRFSDKSRSEQAAHFQPEQGRILFSANTPHATWQPGAQDRLSIFFQLAAMLAGDPARFQPNAKVNILTAGARDADMWTFTVTGMQTLALPAGEQATVALRREPRREYDQTVEIWFAPGLGYLPVRIRLTQANGDVLDQKLASLQPM